MFLIPAMASYARVLWGELEWHFAVILVILFAVLCVGIWATVSYRRSALPATRPKVTEVRMLVLFVYRYLPRFAWFILLGLIANIVILGFIADSIASTKQSDPELGNILIPEDTLLPFARSNATSTVPFINLGGPRYQLPSIDIVDFERPRIVGRYVDSAYIEQFCVVMIRPGEFAADAGNVWQGELIATDFDGENRLRLMKHPVTIGENAEECVSANDGSIETPVIPPNNRVFILTSIAPTGKLSISADLVITEVIPQD